MRQILSAILILTLAVIGVAGLVFLTVVRPWMAVPGDPGIDTRWSQVEGWAALDASTGDATPLIKAELAVEQQRDALEALLQKTSGTAPLREAAIPVAGQIALRSLSEWDAAGGGLGDEVCAEAVDGMPLLTLGRLLLATAGKDVNGPEVGLAVRLAATLRGSGDLRKVAVGFYLSDELRRWTQDRGLRPPTSFATLRPRTGEAFAAVARDSVCTLRRERARLDSFGMQALLLEVPKAITAPILAVPFLSASRELKVYQQYHGARLVEAAEVKDNLLRLEPRLRLPSADNLPSSVLVRATARDASDYIARWRQVIESYNSMLKAHHISAP